MTDDIDFFAKDIKSHLMPLFFMHLRDEANWITPVVFQCVKGLKEFHKISIDPFSASIFILWPVLIF